MISTFPTLRSDLEILPRPRWGNSPGGFLIKDPHTEETFEMEEEEYFLCRQLDGQTSLEVIRARFEDCFTMPLPLADLEAFIRQLDFQGFLTAPVTEGMIHYWELEGAVIPVQRFVLFNPSRLLSWLNIHLWWGFTHTFVLSSLAFVVFGFALLIVHWATFVNALYGIWQPHFFPLLILVGVGCVQVTHEFAHGLVSAHYGGQVREAGVMVFYHILPKFYLDRRQTVSITTRDRSNLYWVFFIGLYWQLLLVSLGVVGVLLTRPGSNAHYFWTALWSTAVMGAIHNGNIAHRRDLYWLFTTWLGMPQLRERAVTVMLNWLLRRPEPEPLTPRERFWLRTYGLLAPGYYLVHGSIMITLFGDQLTQAFQGTGVVAFVAVLLFLLHRPLFRRLGRPARWLMASKARALPRWFVRLGWGVVITGVLFIPYPYETGGAFKVLPLKQTQIHAEVEGKIVEVLVKENDWVRQNQALARIDSREYEKNLKATQEQLAAAEARLRLLFAGPKPEEVTRAEQQVKKNQQDVKEAEKKLSFSRPRAARFTKLYEEEVVSQQDYENAIRERDVDIEQLNVALQALEVSKANLALVKSGARPEEIQAQEAEVRRLQTLVADYQEQLRLTVLASPVEGQVITPYVDQKVGQYLKKGDLFATVVDPRTVQIEVMVPEEEIPYVQTGARLKVVTWAFPGTTLGGTVLSVAPVAQKSDEGTNAVRVLAEIPNPNNMLKADMTGYAKSSTRGKPVWDVLFRRIIRWFQVQFWYWLP